MGLLSRMFGPTSGEMTPWKSSCQAKYKIFFCLLLHDRVNTRNILFRICFHLETYNCATMQCGQEETPVHLFWTCPMGMRCWDYVCPQRNRNLSLHEAFSCMKSKLNLSFFIDLLILASWSIWMIRNNKLFRNERPTFERWKAIYLLELNWLKYRIKAKYSHQFNTWRETQT